MKFFIPILALLFGLIGGWFIARPAASNREGTSQATRASGNVESFAVASSKSETNVPEAEDLTVAEQTVADATGDTPEWLTALVEMEPLEQLSVLLDRMRDSSSEDFGTLMTAIQKYQGSLRWTAQLILATKWVATDSLGMLAYLESQPDDQQRSLRNLFYSVWAKEDPTAAYASVLQLANPRTQLSAMQSVIRIVANTNPQGAIEMATEMSAMGHRADWLMGNIYESWANTEPEAARESALNLPDGPEKVKALSGALQNWIQEDSIAALGWLDSLPMNGTIYNSRKEVYRNLLNRDFDAAKEFIASKTDPMERQEVIENISLGNLGWQKDFDEILEVYDWVGEVAKGQSYDAKVGDVIRSLVQADPARAEAFVLNLPAGNARMNALKNYARQLAERDPVAAINFAQSMGDVDEKDRVLQGMSWRLTRDGSDGIRSLVASSEDPEIQRKLASGIVSDWSKYDQEGALLWADSLSDENARERALQSVYKNWMQADPNAALAYLETSVVEHKQQNFLRDGFHEWSRQDPAEAVTWLDQLPEGVDENEGANLYGSVARNYVQHDPMAASEWISTLDKGPKRDSSVETLVRSISKTDPEAGFIWASTVSDEKKRKNTLNESLREWIKVDLNAAYDAVTEADLEAAEKKPLLDIIENAKEK